jgi:streptogramin lyase
MRYKLSSLASGFATVCAAVLGTSHSQAAQGQLYSGGLGDMAVYRFSTTAPVTRSVFVTGPFADAIAFDPKGNLFVSDTQAKTIIKITPTGAQTTFATNINSMGLAFDGAGFLYATDTLSNSVKKFNPAGGAPTSFVSGLSGPFGLAFDPADNLFVSLTGTNSILKITPAKAQSTIATGLSSPEGLVADAATNVYEADFGTGNIFKFTPAGNPVGTTYTKSTFGTALSGGLSAAPRHITRDRLGNLYVSTFVNQQILKFPSGGGTSTVFASNNNAGGLAFEPPTSDLTNISTRAPVGTGDRVTIAGFIVRGTVAKSLLLRGLGPTLARQPYNVPGVLQDPTLALHNSTSTLASNDNWANAANANQIPTNFRPPDARESAILTTLGNGNYSAILAGKNSTTGNGLVEAYDFDNYSNPVQFINISTRAFTGTGDSIADAGFMSSGGNNVIEVVIRGLGPTLAQPPYNVPGVLADPQLSVYDRNGNVIASNNDWRIGQPTLLQVSGLAPPNDKESAVVLFLAPGSYSAILTGNGGGTGIGLIEVYKVLR